MKLVSSGFSIRVAPSVAFGLEQARVDPQSLSEWEVGQDFEISAHIYPEATFRDYLKATPLDDVVLLQSGNAYVRISDPKKWCEIAICASDEVITELKCALQTFGIYAEIEASTIFPAVFRMAGENRIFVTTGAPWITVCGKTRT